MAKQLQLPFSAIRNADLLSSHWLEKRLPLEPEWSALQSPAAQTLDRLAELWDRQKNLVSHYQDEAGLEQAFIQPVLQALGWTLKYQAFLQGREPDYALFLNAQEHAAAIKAGRNNAEFWKYPKVLGDAKAWHIPLDRPITTASQREFPPQQIEWYLDRSSLDYAILTNGQLWRLIPRQRASHQQRFQTYLECSLPEILNRYAKNHLDYANLDDFRRFFLFFSPHAYVQPLAADPLIARAVAGSSAYRLSASEGLKERVFQALSLCIEGFINHRPNALNPPTDLAACRANAFTLLYRLLFIFFAEDRQLLPYRRNQLYTANRALSRFRDDIASALDKIKLGQLPELSKSTTTYWQDIALLFDLIDKGKSPYGVPAYNGGLFNADDHPFLREKAIPDFHIARVIDCLGRAVDPNHPDDPPFPVDYKDLAIQDLGNVYEGLLELHPRYATVPMKLIRARRSPSGQRPEERIIADADPLPPGFESAESYPLHSVYLATDKGERRASGSYYTPDHIVQYIVAKTLGPLCAEIDQKLNAEIAATEKEARTKRGATRETFDKKLADLRADFDDRVLELRVLDPAMGSGHFLLRACQFLAEEIATNPHAADPGATNLRDDESIIIFWKRKVVENCLYGTDLNPVAVELAKLALWLETVSTTQPLSFLDHHLRHGNSLVGAFVDQLDHLPDEPPLLQNAFQNQISLKLPILLGSLQQIRSLPSDTIPQVKDKEKIFLKTIESERRPFRLIADLWTSIFFAPPTAHVSPADYASLIAELGASKTFMPVRNSQSMRGAQDALRPVAPFHWELEFPDVFFNHKGRLANPGFHAIIGNPPYDVLEKNRLKPDSPHDALIKYSKVRSDLQPALGHKTNLFRFFLVQSVTLLASRGNLGMIVPLAILGDISCGRTRSHLLRNLETLDAACFPQKDNPKRRVFVDAKLSTVVLVGTKRATPDEGIARINVRVYPWDSFDDIPRRCSVAGETLLLLDPENLPIPLVSEQDWSICQKIHRHHEVSRLGDVNEFAITRGEINQTTYSEFITGNPRHTRMLKGSELEQYGTKDPRQGEREWFDEAGFLAVNTARPVTRSRRIATQRITGVDDSRRIIATIIEPHIYFADSTNSIALKVPARHCLEYLVALLNSTLFQWRFRLTSTNNNVGTNELECLPFRNIDPSSAEDQTTYRFLSRTAQEIMELRREVPTAGERRQREIRIAIDRYLEAIDDQVFALYGLTEDEVSFIRQSEGRYTHTTT